MPISYDKLWKLLIDKKMNRTDLKDASGISFNVLAKMGKNEFVSMESLMKIPKHFFVPDIIEKRRPLAENARRAGWVGCNIIIGKTKLRSVK